MSGSYVEFETEGYSSSNYTVTCATGGLGRQAIFGAVLAEARNASDVEATTRAQGGLGLAAAQAGRPRQAIEALEQVIDTPGVTPATQPGLRTSARSFASVRETNRALKDVNPEMLEIRHSGGSRLSRATIAATPH